MMMQEHLIVPSEGGTNSSGNSSSTLENSNRVALNVSFSTMSATVGSPPPPPNHGHILGNDHQNINHHLHHNSEGTPSDNRYGIFGEKVEPFAGVGPGIGGAPSASSDASSSSSSGGGPLWQSHHPSAPSIPNNPSHMTHLPNENDDLKLSQATGMIQRCGSNNSSAATVGHLNGHPDILPPGYIEHHQKQLELAAASATGEANSPSASSPGGASSCGGVMGVTSLLSSPPDIINNSVGNTPGGNSQNKKSSSRRNAWGNLSYADLITQAIKNSPDQRLTLSQVYEWMVANIPYFKDKGDSNSSAGWKNSIRHNLSLHSRFVRVQNEGTGKSSWWMMNPDAKAGSGKNSRRRTPSVDTTVGGPGSNGGSGGVGGRGPDFKRRGRTKKNNMGVGGLMSGHMRNGGPPNNRIGNDSIPSPGVVTSLGMAPGGPGGLYELNPESPAGGPGMLHHHPPYPFTDMRGHPNVGPPDFPVPIGGRISPAGPMRIGGEGNNVPQFNYPGQEWSSEYPPCGPMAGYFPGSIPRGYGEPICSEPSSNDYPRPMSPLHPYSNRTPNGFPYRSGALIPNGNNSGAPLFSSQHNNELPFNQPPQQHIFNSGSHENKLPNSPSNTGMHTMEGVNRSSSGQPHSYSNSQGVSSPTGQANRPISFPSPNVEHSSQNPISTTSSSSSSVEGSGHVVGSHLSPIGQRHPQGDGFYSQPPGSEDNGNDTNSLCRPSTKTVEGTEIAIQNSDDNADQQGSILEKALAKQDQALLAAQPSPHTNNSSLEWAPSNGETHQLNLSGRGNGYGNGGPESREFMMKQEIDSSSIGDYMQHYHHHGHHPNGPSHDPLSNSHHQVYANSAIHIPAGNEDHHLIRHSSPTVAAGGADQYHASSKHHHVPPWVR